MRLSRGRGLSHHPQRDYAQERADLNEGYNNYRQDTEKNIQEVLENPDYSAEQKKNYLNFCKEDLLQKEQEYLEAMEEIRQSEAQQLGEENADAYCSFFDDPQTQAGAEADAYFGSAAGETVSTESEYDAGISNDL